MADIPQEAVMAAVRALQDRPWYEEWECSEITEEQIARLILDAAAPLLAEAIEQRLRDHVNHPGSCDFCGWASEGAATSIGVASRT